ncbi:MAG: CHC2 zinc finger domain-containing protein [Thermoguttaceae bacterium]
MLPEKRLLRRKQRRGNQSFWHCPFHEDDSPSFTITPVGKHWKCWGRARRRETQSTSSKCVTLLFPSQVPCGS